jgi:hypothetical protein
MHVAGTPRLSVLLAAAVALVLFAAPATRADVPLPGGRTLEKVDFERHVMGLLGRMGCNAGGCHGSFQGKGGFRLSLFGYEPDKDYFAVTRDSLGRRVNTARPDDSVLLLKATGQVEHGGAIRFSKDSWQYAVFRAWIADGARHTTGSGEVKAVRITPADHAFTKPGEAVQLRVAAQFSDGSEQDITPFCDYRTNDDAVAEVSNLGEIKALRPGSTAVVVTYRGNVLPVRLMIPMELPPGFVYPKVPENNYIDKLVFERLRRLNMVPSDLAPDAEFLRRVSIDTIGRVPTPDEVRAFLADKDPEKRTKKIDKLLADPMHAALWATKLCDITNNDTPALEQPVPLKAKRSQMWHDWFKKRVAENMPYDQIVKGVLVATSRQGRTPEEWLEEVKALDDAAAKGHDYHAYADKPSLDLFWRRQQQVQIEQWGEKTAAAFLGVRLECAQCHKHPFDRWTQAEYRAYANIFGQVTFGISPEAKRVIDEENAARKKLQAKANLLAQVREVWLSPKVRSLPHPDTNRPLPAQALGGPVIPVVPGKDAREALWQWMRSADNPGFARSFVNRIWGHYFGVGLVHPVDDFSIANPPSNDTLLDALAKEFIESGYDIRRLERRILTSRVYQLSSKTNATNKLDKTNFARSYVRPMMAEVVVDAINTALGAQETFGPEIRPGSRAIEIGASQLNQGQAQALNYAFRIFGRSTRTSACDCDRALDPALPQKLYLMTDQAILQKIRAPQGRLAELLKGNRSDDEVLDELFLATLSRYPREADRQLYREARGRAANRAAAFTDVLWALINTREFILQH